MGCVSGRCGTITGMQAAATSMTLRYDEQRRIDQDLPCVCCDYNLRRQPAAGACPECGVVVSRSARAWLLSGLSHRQLARIRLSLLTFVIGIVLIAASVWLPRWMRLEGFSQQWIGLPVLSLAAGFLVFGGWLGLSRGQRVVEHAGGDALRHAARFGLLVGPVLFFALICVEQVRFPYAAPVYVRMPLLLLTPIAMCLAVWHHALSARRIAGRRVRRVLVPFVLYAALSLALWAAAMTAVVSVPGLYASWPRWYGLLSKALAVLSWNMLGVAIAGVWMLLWLWRCLGSVMRDRGAVVVEPAGEAGRTN